MNPPVRPGDLVPLERDDCVELLRSAPYVRIGFVADGAPTILPVNVLWHDGAVYLRTAAGSKLGTAAAGSAVAVEADGGDLERRTAWSVVVHGHASIVTDPAVEEALLGRSFEPWALPDERPFWVCITPERITGRRIERP